MASTGPCLVRLATCGTHVWDRGSSIRNDTVSCTSVRPCICYVAEDDSEILILLLQVWTSITDVHDR